MNATIQIKKDRPNYYVVLDYKDDIGKRQRKWISTDIPVKGNNKRKIEERRKEVLEDYEQQELRKIQEKEKQKQEEDLSEDILFTTFIKEWLESLKYSIAPTTYDAYKITLNVHILPYFESQKIKVKDLTPAHIQHYINFKYEKLSPNTVKKHIANISKCLDSAVNQNLILFNPAKRIEKIKKVKYTGAKFYNEKLMEQLLEVSKGDPLEIVILLTIFYGLRRSEVLGLKWDTIDFINNTLTIKHTVVRVDKIVHKKDTTKNDSSNSVVPLPNIIKAKLIRWRAMQSQHKILQPNDYNNEGYICTQMDGSLIKPDYVSQHFNLLLKRHNMPLIRFHDLRHSSASYLKYLGFDLKDIQTWLRHADIQTTMNLYTHLDMAAKTNIADNLNERFAKLNW